MYEKNREEEELLERYDFLSHSVATMECTGLQYKTAVCGEERGNYKQIYDYMAHVKIDGGKHIKLLKDDVTDIPQIR